MLNWIDSNDVGKLAGPGGGEGQIRKDCIVEAWEQGNRRWRIRGWVIHGDSLLYTRFFLEEYRPDRAGGFGWSHPNALDRCFSYVVNSADNFQDACKALHEVVDSIVAADNARNKARSKQEERVEALIAQTEAW